MPSDRAEAANALLASGTIFPGNPLHQATLAGKPGCVPVFAPCCAINEYGHPCHCPSEDRIKVANWKKIA